MRWNGEALKEQRIGAGYSTQEDLANALGVSRQSVNQWENGTEPTARNLVRICELLNAPMRSLFVAEVMTV